MVAAKCAAATAASAVVVRIAVSLSAATTHAVVVVKSRACSRGWEQQEALNTCSSRPSLLWQLAKKLAGFLGDRQFFGSDGKQGLVDVDLFGYIHYNVGVLKNPYAIAMVGAATCLQAWYDRMKGDAPGQADAFLNLQFMAPNA